MGKLLSCDSDYIDSHFDCTWFRCTNSSDFYYCFQNYIYNHSSKSCWVEIQSRKIDAMIISSKIFKGLAFSFVLSGAVVFVLLFVLDYYGYDYDFTVNLTPLALALLAISCFLFEGYRRMRTKERSFRKHY